MVKSEKVSFSLKAWFEKILPGVVFALLIIQPLLDIISYWAVEWDVTTYTTAIRFLMFAAVMLYGFILSDKKSAYIICGAVIGIYYAAHIFACIKSATGYVSIVSDASNFLRTVHLPLFTFVFITFFKKNKEMPGYVQKAFVINAVVIINALVLSYMTNTQIYTYNGSKLGLMSWASVHNSQSAITVLLVPLSLLFAYKTGKKAAFYAASMASLVCLFFCGTKVDLFSIPIILATVVVMLIIQGEKRPFYYVLIGILLLATLLCYKTSIVYQRKENSEESLMYKQTAVSNAVGDSSDDVVDSLAALGNNISRETFDSLDTMTKKQIIKIYKTYQRPMINRFGFDRVFEKYEYTLNVKELVEGRQRKRYFAELCWEDSNLLTKCFGYEYITLIEDYPTLDENGNKVVKQEIFDLENDFPAVFYYSGYVGFALYIAFFAYFALLMLVAVVTRFKKTVNLESGMIGVSYLLTAGIAQLSGNVLRRPNVSIYVSFIFAYIYYLTVIKENVKLCDIFKVFKKDKSF